MSEKRFAWTNTTNTTIRARDAEHRRSQNLRREDRGHESSLRACVQGWRLPFGKGRLYGEKTHVISQPGVEIRSLRKRKENAAGHRVVVRGARKHVVVIGHER